MTRRTINMAATARPRTARSSRRGFTLVEIIISILVLGVGLIALAALFPAGIAQQQFANDDTFGRLVADQALGVIRSKVKPEDFGTYEEFYLTDARATGASGAPQTNFQSANGNTSFAPVQGDWGWKRPGFIYDNPLTNTTNESKIDIFSWELTRLKTNATPQQPIDATGPMIVLDISSASDPKQASTEYPGGLVPNSVPNGLDPPARHTLYGIPYNRQKYDSDLAVGTFETEIFNFDASGNPLRRAREPAFFITQAERTYPQHAVGTNSPPQYLWECMFRRFEGRILVAIFVYRVVAPGGEPRPYSTVMPSSGTLGQPQSNTSLPPLPVTIKLNPAWDPTLPSPPNPAADIAPGTTAGSAYNPANDSQSWELPGQWILDKNNNVHRVLSGRRMQADGPVRFARRIPTTPAIPTYIGQPNNATLPPNTIDQIWYLPGKDSAGNTLIPVYCTVQEL